MATKFNQIRNRITADDKTGSAFQSAGRNATKYGSTSSKAAERAQRAFRATSIAVTAMAAAGVAAVAGAFRLTESMAKTEDQAGKFAGRLNIAVEELTRYQHVAGLSGVSTETLQKSFQKLPKSVADAAKGLAAPRDALAKLNLEAADLMKLDPVQQFEAISLAMEGVANTSDRVQIAQDLMGRGGVEMLQIINQGTEAMRLMKEESDLLGLTITGTTAASAASFNDELLRLQSTTTGIIRIFTNELKPIFTVVFREIKIALLDSREASQDFAASIQDKIVAGLKVAIEVMRFFHNAWLGIKLVGTVAMTAIAVALEGLLVGLRVLLTPLDLIFAGLVAIGEIEVNPFDTAQAAMADFTAASVDQTSQIISDIEATNAAYDEVGRTIDGISEKINAQRAANEVAGAGLSAAGAVEDPRVTQERLTQEQLLAIKQEARDIELETELAFDVNFEAIHKEQMARKQREIDLEAATAKARTTAIKSGLGNLATIARASNASFETQKKISIAQGLVGTYQATVDAYKSAGNPYLGAVLAALAFAANIAQVNAMKRTKPGTTSAGAGAAGGALPSASAAVPAAPAAPIQQAQPAQAFNLTIQLEGDLDPDMFAAKLMPSFDKFTERGTFPQVQIASG